MVSRIVPEFSSVVSTYTTIFSRSSSIGQAWIHPTGISISRSVRSLDEDRLRVLNENYLLPSATDSALSKVRGVLAHDLPLHLVFQDLSPSGNISIVCRFMDEKSTFDITSESTSQNLRIDASEKHGKPIADSWFGGYSWSSDEKYFTYVAQEKKVKPTACFEAKKNGDATINGGSKFDFVEDWGEKYVGVSSLVICILNVATKNIVIIPAPFSTLTIGQPQLSSPSPGHYYLTYTAWKTEPRRLGMIYCYHRPCSIYTTDVTTALLTSSTPPDSLEHIKISKALYLARSPRISPSGRSIIFLGSERGFSSHGGPSQLFRVKIQKPHDPSSSSFSFSEPELLLDNVDEPQRQAAGEINFPGLYADQFPRRCFLTEHSIALSSTWGSVERVLLVDLETRAVRRLAELAKILDETKADATSLASCSVLCASDNSLVYVASSPSTPSRLGFARLSGLMESGIQIFAAPLAPRFDLVRSDTTSAASTVADPLQWQVLHLEESGIPFEAILVKPPACESSLEPIPLIVIPHGGPHGCSTTAYSPAVDFLCRHLQAAALHVNYRGSTGFGAKSIKSLLGRIGENDVQDMVSATRVALNLDSGIDKHRVAVVGGSHGGFLGGHLIGQYPELFKVAVLRNPVLDIPGMVSVTDIPDWCHVEALGEGAYDFSTYRAASPAALNEMFERSPVKHVDNIKAPTLIVVGSKDLRVPASQGINFHHMLRAKSIPTRLLVFPEDVHAIDKPASEIEQWLATSLWLSQHLHKSSSDDP